MMCTQLRSWFRTALIVTVVCGMLATGLSSSVVAQSATSVTFDSGSETFDSSTTIDLVAADVPADSSIGAYKLNVTYDSDVVTLSAAGTDRFNVSTETTGSSGMVTTTVVGYTGAADGSGGNTTLATLSLTSSTSSGSTTLSVSTIETFADTDGESVSYTNDAKASLTIESSGDSDDGSDGSDGSDDDDSSTGGDDDDAGGGGGGGGAIAPPEDDATGTESMSTEMASNSTATESESSATSTEADTETETEEPTDTEADIEVTAPPETTTGSSGPGFTASAAFVALLSVALLLRRQS